MGTIIIAIVSFAVGIIFSESLRAWFDKEQGALHAKLDKILSKVDPNATQPPAK